MTLKTDLVEEMRILQGNNDSTTKKASYANIVKIINTLKETDPVFAFDSKVLEKFSAFRPDDMPEILKKVKWADGIIDKELKQKYNSIVATSREIVEERFPNIDTDSDKFGLIVNATTANLIALNHS